MSDNLTPMQPGAADLGEYDALCYQIAETWAEAELQRTLLFALGFKPRPIAEVVEEFRQIGLDAEVG